MPSVIATKIEADLRDDRGNSERCTGLADYCANPESRAKTEKCVSFRALGFSEEEPDIELIKDEIRFDMEKSWKKDVELVAHWVMSFNGEPDPSEEKIFEAAEDLLMDLGYTKEHKRYFAIHVDTDNLHVHIVACKSDPYTGRINSEGWWKNESQKSIARSAHKFGWQLEAGAPFVVPPNPRMEKALVAGKEIMRPRVERRPKRKEEPSIRCHAAKSEQRTGVKSGQRRLQEVLRGFLEEHRDDFGKWKCGDFHRELAEIGVTCDRVQHGESYGLTYTIDGENFEAGSDVCPGLTYKGLMEKLSAREWRDAREKYKEIAATVRASFEPHDLLPQERAKLTWKKDIVNKMRKIPIAEVWKAFGLVPRERNRAGRPIRNAFDICMSRGLSFCESADWLAQKFPEILEGKKDDIDVDGMLEGVREQGVAIKPEHLPKARKMAGVMGAMRADRLDLETRERSGKRQAYKGQTLADLCRRIEVLGKPGIEVLCRPVWEGKRRGIVISSPKPEIFRHFPEPNLLIEGKAGGAVYLLEKRAAEEKFCGLLERLLNRRFGDVKMDGRIGVPGLDANARINGWRGGIVGELDDYANRLFEQWKRGEFLGIEVGCAPSGIPLLSDSLYHATQRVEVPPDLLKVGLAELDRLHGLWGGRGMDPGLVDVAVARLLYREGATPDQVYSFMLEHGEKGGDSRRTAISAAPANLVGEGSKWRIEEDFEPPKDIWRAYISLKNMYAMRGIARTELKKAVSAAMRHAGIARGDIEEVLRRDGAETAVARHICAWLYSAGGDIALYKMQAENFLPRKSRFESVHKKGNLGPKMRYDLSASEIIVESRLNMLGRIEKDENRHIQAMRMSTTPV